MWYDELFTLYMAKQASPAEIVKAAIEGVDGAPPLYAIVVHYLLPFAKTESLAVRLPATLGYCGMLVCLLAFCRRRLPPAFCLIAALLACDACFYYSTEGRPYGPMLGCAAAALLCWQTAASGSRRGFAVVGLALSLSLMVSMHYYAVFFLGPLLLAELVRARTRRKLDIGILAALMLPLLVLALHYPVIAGSTQLAAHHWSPASFRLILPFYYNICFPSLFYAAVVALAVLAVFPTKPEAHTADEGSMPAYEWVAISALALMPPIVCAVSKYTTHVFVDRYVMWSEIGFACVAAALLCRAVRGHAVVGLALLGYLVGLVGLHEMGSLRSMRPLREGDTVRAVLNTIPDGNEPIVIPDSHVFLELSFYAEPRISRRLVYPISSELDLRYLGYDTDNRNISALGRRANIHARELDSILADSPRFLLVATPRYYLPWHYVEIGFRVLPVPSLATRPVLFEVAAPSKN
jgi:hypothetical protein